MSDKTLVIDWTRCDGHGTCAALAPELIGRDEWGYPVLAPDRIDGARTRTLRRLASACPAMALRIERGGPQTAGPTGPRSGGTGGS